jgi:hypothetical protein
MKERYFKILSLGYKPTTSHHVAEILEMKSPILHAASSRNPISAGGGPYVVNGAHSNSVTSGTNAARSSLFPSLISEE